MDEQRKELIKKYIIIVSAIIGIFVLIGITVMFIYSAIDTSSNKNNPTPPPTFGPSASPTPDSASPASPTATPSSNPIVDLFTPPDRTTVLIMGLHEVGAIADTIFLATYDAKAGQIDILSLPRDLQIILPQDDISALRNLGRNNIPSNGLMKLGELHSYAGTDYGAAYTKKYVQALLNVQIDYFAVMDLAAFRAIVDLVDGVYMQLPPEGFFYEDPEQNLYINVPGGYQLLKGKDAEGVVRFRDTYALGDLQRIEVQQQFIKCFFEQALNKTAIMNNLTGYLSTVIGYVKTDFKATDITKYLTSLRDLSASSLSFYTLPGRAENEAPSYFIYDGTSGQELVTKIFK